MSLPIANIDRLNFLLVILACVIAHILPAELLIASYAILGPAHYLTEISWLHDRQYFTKNRTDYMPLVIGTVLIFIPSFLYYPVLIGLFVLAITMAFLQSWSWRIALLILCVPILIILQTIKAPSFYFFLLLPTVVHVFVFTFLFVWSGALRNKSGWGYATLAAMAVSAYSFTFYDMSALPLSQWGEDGLSVMAKLLKEFASVLGVDEQGAMFDNIIGFLGFAYSYHYLNWFSKTNVIGWNNISVRRRGWVIGLFIISISVYLYDYALGFKLLLFLSFLHVVLEFPLNAISIKEIARLTFGRMTQRA